MEVVKVSILSKTSIVISEKDSLEKANYLKLELPYRERNVLFLRF